MKKAFDSIALPPEAFTAIAKVIAPRENPVKIPAKHMRVQMLFLTKTTVNEARIRATVQAAKT